MDNGSLLGWGITMNCKENAMNDTSKNNELLKTLDGLICNRENEIVEFKQATNSFSQHEVGKCFSAISNDQRKEKRRPVPVVLMDNVASFAPRWRGLYAITTDGALWKLEYEWDSHAITEQRPIIGQRSEVGCGNMALPK